MKSFNFIDFVTIVTFQPILQYMLFFIYFLQYNVYICNQQSVLIFIDLCDL